MFACFHIYIALPEIYIVLSGSQTDVDNLTTFSPGIDIAIITDNINKGTSCDKLTC